ncbi:ABC transporter substrate-binding protein [Paenibacillus selenitireducens]|uniref:ABC transporter substrate-binding protein n=1 Tax=Paenibacillus selenitireducens TaxID=1324314 RepID=A0A1T2XHU6_9BACL|nr:extracellular solute-binding protein [Paenibacillus selenitireducens]OPA79440.1 ABC transporter substrate-binding protein [Paenibacillus selenitireducens]
MKRNVKKFGVILLTSLLALSIAACSTSGSDQTQEGTTADGKTTEGAKLTNLSYWVSMHSAAAAQMKTYAEMGMYKELEKITGVKVDFEHPPSDAAQAKEQFNLMMVSEKLPDVIETSWIGYPGGPEKAIQDNKIIKLNDYIDQYAPNLKKLLTDHPDWKKQVTTDDGNMYMFPFFRGGDKVRVFYGPAVRKDWLDKLGLTVPTTIDEWHEVLTAFKDKDPNGNGKADEIPLYITLDDVALDAPFLGAWGINYGFYQDGGKVKFGPTQPEYKEFLTTMNKWYQEGLIDKDFAAPNSKLFDAKMTGNQLGAALVYNGGGIGKYANLMKDKDPNFNLVAAEYPVLKKGDKQMWGQKDFATNGIGAAISTSNKNPIETVKWLDYAYGEQGDLLFNYGKEGEAYSMVNGVPTFLPEVLNPPSGVSLQQSFAKHNRSTWSAPFVLSENFQMQYLALDNQKDALSIWSHPTGERKMPLVTPTNDESSQFASIMTDINTYKDEMFLKFIMGAEPLDNFDKYVKKIETMGIEDALKIQQAALERFNKR